MIGYVFADAGTDGPPNPSIKHPCTVSQSKSQLQSAECRADLYPAANSVSLDVRLGLGRNFTCPREFQILN